MQIGLVISLCFVSFLSSSAYAETENEVKRGAYPYMAFVYYPDDTVVDMTGSRFLRSAILIRPDWLVSSAVGDSIVKEVPRGFPRKTLLARLGATTITANFTLNEDEDEQEREVIQIVRPYNQSSTQWWLTDISLMKTLLPFNMTSAVATVTVQPKREYIDKTCIILIYARKFGNWTEDKILMQLSVELLPPSIGNCGSHFAENTMTCASDSSENKNYVYDPDFCQGNSGGPLICENEVIGLQTYIDNNCKQPHLYQLLSAWETFIKCGTEEKCSEDQCSQICSTANKDIVTTTAAEATNVNLVSVETELTSKESSSVAVTSKATVAKEMSRTPKMTPELDKKTTKSTPSTTTTEVTTLDSSTADTEEKSWPKESLKTLDHEDVERNTNVEAQLQNTPKRRSSAERNVCYFQSLFFSFIILAGFI